MAQGGRHERTCMECDVYRTCFWNHDLVEFHTTLSAANDARLRKANMDLRPDMWRWGGKQRCPWYTGKMLLCARLPRNTTSHALTSRESRKYKDPGIGTFGFPRTLLRSSWRLFVYGISSQNKVDECTRLKAQRCKKMCWKLGRCFLVHCWTLSEVCPDSHCVVFASVSVLFLPTCSLVVPSAVRTWSEEICSSVVAGGFCILVLVCRGFFDSSEWMWEAW